MRHLLVAVGLLASNAAFALACPTADFNLGSSTGPGLLLGTTCGMGNEDTKTCAGTDGEDVSFVWTAPMDGTVGFSLDGSSYDTALQAKEFGTCADTVCNDDFFGLDSYVELTVTAGQTYYLSIDGFNGGCGDYILGVDYVTPPFALQAGTGGGMVMLQATNAPANTRVYFLASAQTGSTCHPSGIVCADLRAPRVLGSALSDAAGTANFSLPAPPALPPVAYFQAAWLDLGAGMGGTTPLATIP